MKKIKSMDGRNVIDVFGKPGRQFGIDQLGRLWRLLRNTAGDLIASGVFMTGRELGSLIEKQPTGAKLHHNWRSLNRKHAASVDECDALDKKLKAAQTRTEQLYSQLVAAERYMSEHNGYISRYGVRYTDRCILIGCTPFDIKTAKKALAIASRRASRR